jgi:hypothetical protein
MRGTMAGIATALLLLAPLQAWAQDDGSGGGYPAVGGAGGFDDPDLGSHIKPGGPRGPQPIERKKFDEAVAKLFKSADSNGDGTITLAELNAVIDARKQAVIGARFAQVDTDRDKSISFDEFSQWQRSLGSAVLSDSAATGQLIVPEDIRYDPGRGDNDQLLAQLIEPLNATMLVAANTDYDAGVTLAELTAYEGKRWDGADANHDGWLTADEIGIYLPKARGGRAAPGGRGRPPG